MGRKSEKPQEAEKSLITEVGFPDGEPQCPFCRAKGQFNKNGSYTTKRDIAGRLLKVLRYVCKRCGRHFNAHTTTFSGTVFKQLEASETFKRIDNYILSNGLSSVDELKTDLGIGTAIYYRYMAQLAVRTGSDLSVPRPKHSWKRTILIEISQRVGSRNLRYFLLLDAETEGVVGHFFLTKETPPKSSDQTLSGRSLTWSMLIRVLLDLKTAHPKFKLELAVSPSVNSRLSTSAETKAFTKDADLAQVEAIKINLKKYRFYKTASFAWTVYGKREAKVKNLFDNRNVNFRNTLGILITIYNLSLAKVKSGEKT